MQKGKKKEIEEVGELEDIKIETPQPTSNEYLVELYDIMAKLEKYNITRRSDLEGLIAREILRK